MTILYQSDNGLSKYTNKYFLFNYCVYTVTSTSPIKNKKKTNILINISLYPSLYEDCVNTKCEILGKQQSESKMEKTESYNCFITIMEQRPSYQIYGIIQCCLLFTVTSHYQHYIFYAQNTIL